MAMGRRSSCVFFFFQAEDGIRDKLVTGVQTCALPISADDSEQRPRPARTAYHEPIVAAVQEDTDLLRLSAVECAAVEGWSPRAGGQPHRHPPACEALDLREIPLVGAVDLHDLGEQRVIAVADLRQVVTPPPQR